MIYFAEVKNILDPLKAGRVQVHVINLEDPIYKETGRPDSEWFYCIATNNSSSILYDVGDRVVVTFLNSEANKVGLVLGKVNTAGVRLGPSPHTNSIEQGLYNSSEYGLALKSHPMPSLDPQILFNIYPFTRTNVYHRNLLSVSDEKQSLIQDSKGSFIFFDTLSNLFIKSILNITLYCIGKMLLFSPVNIELKVGAVTSIELSNESIKVEIGPSSIELNMLGIHIKGPAIWLN